MRGACNSSFPYVVGVLIPLSIRQMPSGDRRLYDGFERRMILFAMQLTCSANDFFSVHVSWESFNPA